MLETHEDFSCRFACRSVRRLPQSSGSTSGDKWEADGYLILIQGEVAEVEGEKCCAREREECARIADECAIEMITMGNGLPEHSESRERCFARAREAERIAVLIRAQGIGTREEPFSAARGSRRDPGDIAKGVR